MRAFETGSPELYRFVRQLKNVSAAVRPLTSVVLFSIGWGPAAHACRRLAPLVDMGTHSVAPIIADFASGAAAAVAGDSAIAGTREFPRSPLSPPSNRFHEAPRRLALGHLKERLFGTVPADLQAAAAVPRTEAFIKLAEGTAGSNGSSPVSKWKSHESQNRRRPPFDRDASTLDLDFEYL